jgi:hypothetical protein
MGGCDAEIQGQGLGQLPRGASALNDRKSLKEYEIKKGENNMAS